MPCVLPVLSLKILSIVSKAKSHKLKLHGLAYTLGICLSLLVLSLLLIILKKGGQIIGWGFHLQSPTFVALLAYLLFAIGLNLSGVYEIPFLFSYTEKKHDIIASGVLSGILATLLSTPCTTPFIASAMVYSTFHKTLTILPLFQMIGLGLATPYLVLCLFPRLLKFLPKPGKWMQTLRQFLAFPMYLSSIWLIWVAINQTNSKAILFILGGVVLIYFTIWSWQFVKQYNKYLRYTTMVLLITSSVFLASIHGSQSTSLKTIRFSQTELSSLLNSKQAVFVNITADWCITCKANEYLVLKQKWFINALQNRKIKYIRGDWTSNNTEITEYLHTLNRNGVPLYLLYKSKNNYIILPQVLTKHTILKALNNLS